MGSEPQKSPMLALSDFPDDADLSMNWIVPGIIDEPSSTSLVTETPVVALSTPVPSQQSSIHRWHPTQLPHFLNEFPSLQDRDAGFPEWEWANALMKWDPSLRVVGHHLYHQMPDQPIYQSVTDDVRLWLMQAVTEAGLKRSVTLWTERVMEIIYTRVRQTHTDPGTRARGVPLLDGVYRSPQHLDPYGLQDQWLWQCPVPFQPQATVSPEIERLLTSLWPSAETRQSWWEWMGSVLWGRFGMHQAVWMTVGLSPAVQQWLMVEVLLPLFGSAMTVVTSSTVLNDPHWVKSVEGQRLVVISDPAWNPQAWQEVRMEMLSHGLTPPRCWFMAGRDATPWPSDVVMVASCYEVPPLMVHQATLAMGEPDALTGVVMQSLSIYDRAIREDDWANPHSPPVRDQGSILELVETLTHEITMKDHMPVADWYQTFVRRCSEGHLVPWPRRAFDDMLKTRGWKIVKHRVQGRAERVWQPPY